MTTALDTLWAVLLAGGAGQRFHAETSKLLAPLAGKPVLRHSVERLLAGLPLVGMVIVVHPAWEADYRTCLAPLLQATTVPIRWVCGGGTRRASVFQGLQAVPAEAGTVLVHDAARPLVRQRALEALLTTMTTLPCRGASLGYPATDSFKTVRLSSPFWVTGSLDRATLWHVQTPQIFRAEALREAHHHVPKAFHATDDAALVEQYFAGESAVVMVADTPWNLKITTPTDLRVAEILLEREEAI